MKNVNFKIYQLKQDVNRDYKWAMLKEVKERKLSVKRDNYNEVYAGGIDFKEDKNTYQALSDIHYIFNMDHPESFKGHSLSVSDIVEIEGVNFYCDSFGWKVIEEF